METNVELRKVQMIQVDMMKEVDRLCKKHGIKYFLCGGTLIGAVRHEGFIPWDDDIDVMLLRNDYERLMKVLADELAPKYFHQTFDTDKGYKNMYGKIRCNDTVFIERDVRDHKMHHGIYLDIFPIDHIPDSKTARLIHKNILYLLNALRVSSNRYTRHDSSSKVKWMIRYAVFPVAKMVVHRPFLRLLDQVGKAFRNKETRVVSSLYRYGIPWYDDPKQAHERSLYERLDYKKFEDMYYPVPAGWHEYLSMVYGDYMELPPLGKQKSHHNAIRVEVG